MIILEDKDHHFIIIPSPSHSFNTQPTQSGLMVDEIRFPLNFMISLNVRTLANQQTHKFLDKIIQWRYIQLYIFYTHMNKLN